MNNHVKQGIGNTFFRTLFKQVPAWAVGHGKEFTKSGLRNLKDAQRILRDVEERIYRDEMDVNLDLTLNEYWEIYSAKKEKTGQWNDTSIYTNAGIYRTMIKEKWGNLPLKKNKSQRL